MKIPFFLNVLQKTLFFLRLKLAWNWCVWAIDNQWRCAIIRTDQNPFLLHDIIFHVLLWIFIVYLLIFRNIFTWQFSFCCFFRIFFYGKTFVTTISIPPDLSVCFFFCRFTMMDLESPHVVILQDLRLQTFDGIRFASYRTASKLRYIQKSTNCK